MLHEEQTGLRQIARLHGRGEVFKARIAPVYQAQHFLVADLLIDGDVLRFLPVDHERQHANKEQDPGSDSHTDSSAATTRLSID